jgi:hypothetical protein
MKILLAFLTLLGSASAQEQHQNKTHFNDYEVSKASNPVISTDGRLHFKMQGPPTAGVGNRALIYWFKH